ncbi:hypothetical protein KKB55_17090, partial [Myxococcota bacterium]|nr:hypothetical protein [Myxococcota bacterium]
MSKNLIKLIVFALFWWGCDDGEGERAPQDALLDGLSVDVSQPDAELEPDAAPSPDAALLPDA